MFKSRWSRFAAALAGAGLIASAAHAQEPRSFPLLCQAGPGQSIDVIINNGGTKTDLYVRFRGASSGVSARPPKAAECAWLDRGWRKGEPEILHWQGDLANFRLLFKGDRVTPHGNSSGPTPGDREFKYLLEALTKYGKFQVYAHAQSRGSQPPELKITRIGP
jgi:hypothetical protein